MSPTANLVCTSASALAINDVVTLLPVDAMAALAAGLISLQRLRVRTAVNPVLVGSHQLDGVVPIALLAQHLDHRSRRYSANLLARATLEGEVLRPDDIGRLRAVGNRYLNDGILV
ncbi:MAG: hypothetical protein WDO73_20590 [Ignavibacteriota bacterium]